MEVENSKTSRSLTATLAIAFAALSVVVLLIAGSFEMKPFAPGITATHTVHVFGWGI